MGLPKRDGLNIVPFIDIMLVLLAIVLSISTFIAQGKIKVNLPKSQNAVKSSEEVKITIKVDKESNIFINDEIINDENVSNYVSKIDKEALVILKSDKDSKFESFIKVIDALKSNKHENFAIVTEIE